MARISSKRVTIEAFCIGVLLFLFAPGPIASQKAGEKSVPNELYLLAGTTVDWGSSRVFPVTLYRADGGKLRVVREVVSGVEGARSVHVWEDSIFVIHPLRRRTPRAVAIVSENDPQRIDDVVFESSSVVNKDGSSLADMQVALAETGPSTVDELLPIVPAGTHLSETVLVSVSNSAGPPDQRVRLNDWNEYGALRLDGDAGGPLPQQGFAAAIVGDQLVFIGAFGPQTVIDSLASLQPALRNALTTTQSRALMADGTTSPSVNIVAADQRYVFLRPTHRSAEMSTGNVSGSSNVLVHDRMANVWKSILIEGNTSRLRVFGSWLAAVVSMFNGTSSKPNPGHDSERSIETDRLPNVQAEYGTGPSVPLMPGVLVLQNVGDGRKIRIETGQEDSEILWVGADSVLYRVNDKIYQARIQGDQIKDAAVIVKDDDVPEIHWVFWSK